MQMTTVIRDICQGCGICIKICPSRAIKITGTVVIIDVGLCDDCEECVFACPNGAITG